MRPVRTAAAAVALAALSTGLVAAGPEAHVVTDGTVTSPVDGLRVHYTLFRPAGADADNPVPIVLHSHGWGGSRSRSGFGDWLDEGFAVLSFDQRGFGASTQRADGTRSDAHVQDPDLEAQDVKALIDFAASLDWVQKDVDADGAVIADDPVLGAIGASYGGGYQWVTALTETLESGATRFDAIAPEISWYDLPDSLAPSGVVRTTWVSALYAAGARTLPDYVDQAFAFGAATGQWPDGTFVGQPMPDGSPVPDLDAEFHTHAPAWFVEQGVQLDVPALVRQGSDDNLFNLNQGLWNFERTLTPDAREDSLFVAYNGGHALPNALPAGSTGGILTGTDACADASASGSWAQLTRDFFRAAFAGEDTSALLAAPYAFTTDDGDCLLADAVTRRTLDAAALAPVTVTTSGAGAAQYVPITSGPVDVAGASTLEAVVTSVGVDQRLFLGLAVGTTPADARVVHNNLLPLREPLPVVQAARTLDLPGVATRVEAGETLYLVVSPLSDMYPAHGSTRTPGAVTLEALRVNLSVPEDQ